MINLNRQNYYIYKDLSFLKILCILLHNVTAIVLIDSLNM